MYFWEKFETGGEVNEVNACLELGVSNYASGFVESGYVTHFVQELYQSSTVSIQIISHDFLDEMVLEIATSKGDPLGQDSWYRIFKTANSSEIVVQRRVNDSDIVDLFRMPWGSATGVSQIWIERSVIHILKQLRKLIHCIGEYAFCLRMTVIFICINVHMHPLLMA